MYSLTNCVFSDRYLCEEEELLLHLCQRGCVLCLDGIGCAGTYLPRGDVTCPADDRISLCVAALVRAGFVDQIVVSHGFKYKMNLTSGGGPGLRHCPATFAQRLRR
jgi:predicted metal-dependent phosphotriesterase family hydrolase